MSRSRPRRRRHRRAARRGQCAFRRRRLRRPCADHRAFLTIDRPNLLRFTWSNSNWSDPTLTSVVNVTFEPIGDDETLMSIEHSLLPPEEFDSFHNGWTLTFDQLAAALRAE